MSSTGYVDKQIEKKKIEKNLDFSRLRDEIRRRSLVPREHNNRYLTRNSEIYFKQCYFNISSCKKNVITIAKNNP